MHARILSGLSHLYSKYNQINLHGLRKLIQTLHINIFSDKDNVNTVNVVFPPCHSSFNRRRGDCLGIWGTFVICFGSDVMCSESFESFFITREMTIL